MRKKVIIVLMLSILVLPFISSIPGPTPIQYKIVIDNFEEYSEDYVFVAYYDTGDRYKDKYNYTIFDSEEVPMGEARNELINIYVIEKSKFRGVKKMEVFIQRDSCGNIVVNNVSNNTCNSPHYLVNAGGGFSYPYNVETDPNFIALGIFEKDVGYIPFDSYDRLKLPEIREDHFKLITSDGKIKSGFENSKFYYYYYGEDNFLTKTAYPDNEGNVEIITLTDDETRILVEKGEELKMEEKGVLKYYYDRFIKIPITFMIQIIFIAILFIMKMVYLIRHKNNIKNIFHKNIFTFGLPIFYLLMMFIPQGSCVPSGIPSISGWLHPFWGWMAFGSISGCVDGIIAFLSFMNWILIGLIIDLIIFKIKKK